MVCLIDIDEFLGHLVRIPVAIRVLVDLAQHGDDAIVRHVWLRDIARSTSRGTAMPRRARWRLTRSYSVGRIQRGLDLGVDGCVVLEDRGTARVLGARG